MCLGPGTAEDGNSLTLGSRLVCLLARRRQLPGAGDLCDIPALISVEETGQSPQYSVYIWCFCTELNISSTTMANYAVETQGGRGELRSGERRELWEMTPRALKGARLHNPPYAQGRGEGHTFPE